MYGKLLPSLLRPKTVQYSVEYQTGDELYWYSYLDADGLVLANFFYAEGVRLYPRRNWRIVAPDGSVLKTHIGKAQ